MNTTNYQERINELGQDIANLCEAYSDLPPYEIGYLLIAFSTMFMLDCAPNHLVAMQTILASVEAAIAEYQEKKEK